MSTQAIADYLTKQIFIEKNIVTFRSLSRQLSLHVNAAKNELATYHHNAPYQSQQCSATFFLSGTPRSSRRNGKYEGDDDDVDMDHTPPEASQQEEGDDYDGSEDVSETRITLVNERDLEAAKLAYEELHSIHVYSLQPAPLHDAGLICDRTEFVRSTDKAKGPEWPTTVGRIVGDGIKMGTSKKWKKAPNHPPPAAGPSKLKVAPSVEAKPSKVEVNTKPEPAVDNGREKEKLKGNGKLNFFSKPKETKEVKKEEKETKTVIKKEEPPDSKKKMFFSKPAANTKVPSPAPSKAEKEEPPKKVLNRELSEPTPTAASPAPSVASIQEKEPATRGVKRKSTVVSEREGTLAKSKVGKGNGGARLRGRVVISDDESDDDAPIVPLKSSRRKSRAGIKSDTSDAMDSEAEREALALMDIDDDFVDKVPRAPSTVFSSPNEDEDLDDEEGGTRAEQSEDIDVDMEDDTVSSKPQPKRRKTKAVIPVGANGLKKKKVTKTRKMMDDKGFLRTEDYSDWESVDEEEPEPPKAKKAKTKAGKLVVPLGSNGLKKRKVIKSRKIRDDNGHSHTEDYTDWESAEEEEEEEEPEPPKAKGKAKAKAAVVKQEPENVDVSSVLANTKEKEKESAPKKKAPAPPVLSKTASAKAKVGGKQTGNAKSQKGLLNFFGPTTTKKAS